MSVSKVVKWDQIVGASTYKVAFSEKCLCFLLCFLGKLNGGSVLVRSLINTLSQWLEKAEGVLIKVNVDFEWEIGAQSKIFQAMDLVLEDYVASAKIVK